jgi:hypothetical protein
MADIGLLYSGEWVRPLQAMHKVIYATIITFSFLVSRSPLLCNINYGGTLFQWNVTRGRIQEKAQNVSHRIMRKVEYPNEQWSRRKLVHRFLNFDDKPTYAVEGDNKLLLHFRPQISIWAGDCQNLTAL